MCDVSLLLFFFFFKQKTAYELRISDWSSDVCSSDLPAWLHHADLAAQPGGIDLRQIDAVDQHAAAGGQIEALEQFGQRRLARARGTGDAERSARGQVEADVAQCPGAVGGIANAEGLEAGMARGRGHGEDGGAAGRERVGRTGDKS